MYDGVSETANGIEFAGAFAVSVAITYMILPWLIPKLKAKGIVGRDLNKSDKPEIAEMGGLAVLIGFFAGVSVLIALDGLEDQDILTLLLASLSAILGAAGVGMMDYLFAMP